MTSISFRESSLEKKHNEMTCNKIRSRKNNDRYKQSRAGWNEEIYQRISQTYTKLGTAQRKIETNDKEDLPKIKKTIIQITTI